MAGGFLVQSIVYLGAAIVCVPLAKRLGLGSVLGYLIAGILIGPFVLGFVGEEGTDIMHFAEFGVVVMLFLIGLELEPSKLWKLRTSILGMGMTQVVATTIILVAAGIILGWSWKAALAAALAVSLSSTAMVLQSLKEKGLLTTTAGSNAFSVLLFQDIAVIPILALLPLLAVAGNSAGAHQDLLHDLPAYLKTGFVLGAVLLIVVLGRYAIVPLLRTIARTRLRELFVASALFLIVGIAYVMELVGLSPALGTFLAGVILANSEFKHELESDLDPFKGLLLGLFFLAVGASIDFGLILGNPGYVLSLTAGIVLIKFLVLLGIGSSFRISIDQNLLFAVSLSQVGEFAFVLLSFSSQIGILGDETVSLLMAVTTLSMATTPVLFIINERLLQPRLGTTVAGTRPADAVDEHHAVIIAGFSHFGSTIGRFLRANGVEATILDNDSDRVDLLRKMGFKVYYGDATRADLLESAGASEASILIIAIDDPTTVFGLVETARKHFPNLRLMVRAKNRFDAYELIDLGVAHIYREHLDTSIRLGVDVLRHLGRRAYSVTRASQNFTRYDEDAMWKLAGVRHDMKEYITRSRESIRLQEELLANDLAETPSDTADHAWDSEHMRETIRKMT